jgi:tetratricopeptide (TPR) repeat protein
VELGRALVSRSEALQAVNDLSEATAAIQEARRLFRKHHEPRRELIARDQEAALLYTAARYEESISLLESLIAESASDDPHRPYWLHQIASNLVRSNRDLDRAGDLLAEALRVKDYAANREPRIRALWTTAKIAVLRGQYESALQQLTSVYEQADASAFTSVAMCIRCDMADLLALLGRVDESVHHARAVIDFFAREKLTRRANHALAILREAAQRKKSVTWKDLRRLRAEFPEDFVQPPILGELAPS